MKYPLTGEEGTHERTCNDTIIDNALKELARRTTLTYSPFDGQAFDRSYKSVRKRLSCAKVVSPHAWRDCCTVFQP
jgi:hypothetical protein